MIQHHACTAIYRSLFIFCLACFSLPLSAESVILQQGTDGYSGCEDATIFSDYPANSAGGFPYFFGGLNSLGGIRRGLIRFDLGGKIPTGSTITTASLTVHVDFGHASVDECTLKPMSVAWNEGNNPLVNEETVGQGAPAQAGDSTWNDVSYPDKAWTTPGGVFASTVSATGLAGNPGSDCVLTGTGMVDDLQSWHDQPEANHGWVIQVDETKIKHAKRFTSSESSDPERPALMIEFTELSAVGNWSLY